MTHTQEQLEAMPDKERDALVATLAMKWELLEDTESIPGITLYRWSGRDSWDVNSDDDWSPSTSWDDMGEVLEEIIKRRFNIRFYRYVEDPDDIWLAVVEDIGPVFGERYSVRSTSLPRAVAIAAVLAVQERPDC